LRKYYDASQDPEIISRCDARLELENWQSLNLY